jgi:hypothetical protein
VGYRVVWNSNFLSIATLVQLVQVILSSKEGACTTLFLVIIVLTFVLVHRRPFLEKSRLQKLKRVLSCFSRVYIINVNHIANFLEALAAIMSVHVDVTHGPNFHVSGNVVTNVLWAVYIIIIIFSFEFS